MKAMSRFILLALLSIVASTSLNLRAEPALPLLFSVESDVPSPRRPELKLILDSALTLVSRYPPKGYENNLFQWSADRSVLQGKTFQITLATSLSSTLEPILGNSGISEMDAFTMAPINQAQRKMSVHLILLVDKLLYDSTGHERPNSFARLVVALAHEIYGNVQHSLELKIEMAERQTLADRIYQQRNAYRASLLFLGGLIQNPDFLTMPRSIQDGLKQLLPQEKMAYQGWQNAHPSQALDPACEAMLLSLLPKSPDGKLN